MTNGEMLHMTIAGLDLQERLCHAPFACASDEYKKWMEKSVGGSLNDFKKRLACQNFTISDAPTLLGTPDCQKSADWAIEINKILSLLPSDAEKLVNALLYNPIKKDDTFSSCLLPFLVYCESRLSSIFADELFGDGACRNIMQTALDEIKFIVLKFAQEKMNAMNDGFIPLEMDQLSEYYGDFCEGMLQAGWEDAFCQYPVLGRMIIKKINYFVSFILEIHENIKNDINTLKEQFKAAGEIVAIKLSAGDRHNHGRAVSILEFENRVKIVYKPDSNYSLTAFRKFTDLLTKIDALWHMKLPLVLPRGAYSYVEFIAHEPLPDKDATRRYFHRAGQLLCVLYMLGASDAHFSNVIASGEYPVLIDWENIMSPVIKQFAKTNANRLQTFRQQSVFAPGLLHIKQSREVLYQDFGGIALFDSQCDNSPYFTDGTKIDFETRMAGILEGFEHTYKAVMCRRDEVCKALDFFDGCKIRVLIRTSQTYGDVLRHITYPVYMVDGLTQSFEVERLFNAYCACENQNTLNQLYNIFKAEYQAIMRGDIPIFYTTADKFGIYADGEELYADYIETSPKGNALSRLASMNTTDLKLHLNMVERFLLSAKGVSEHTEEALFTWMPTESHLMSEQLLIDEAKCIFDQIENQRFNVLDTFSWLTNTNLCVNTPNECLGVRFLDSSLYNGSLGLAVFFGALYRSLGDSKYKSSALEIIEQMDISYIPKRTPIGIADGIGSYAFSHELLSDYLNMPVLHQKACSALDLPIFEQVDTVDWLYGLAGYIMAADRVLTGERAKNNITKAADRLISLKIKHGDFNVWESGFSQTPLTGMGHGMAGIALALAKAFAHTGNKQYLTGAIDAISYENHLYTHDHAWPDLRDNSVTKPKYMRGFCSGAPGVGMARLNMLGISDSLDELLLQDVEKALFHSKNGSLLQNDNLCCGNLSCVELLIFAANKLEREELLVQAHKRLSCMIERKNHYGHYIFNPRVKTLEVGLFNGLSGIGYEILRLVNSADNGISQLLY